MFADRKPMLCRLTFISVAIMAPLHPAWSQDDTTKAPVYGWTHGLLAGATLTQASFSNWSQGGENSLAFTLSLDGKSVQKMEKTEWTTTYKFAFGESKLGDKSLRKTDDKIDLETVLGYTLGGDWSAYGAASLKSQFATGYEYDALDNKTAVSAFFDPAYMTQTVGMEYKPGPVFKSRIGAGLRETFTSKYTIYADDPDTPEIEKNLIQGILESVSDLELKLDENLVFTSRLELLAPFETLDKMTVRSDNTLAAKINNYLTAKVNVELLNDWRVTRKTQVRETIAFGFSYALL